MVSKDPEEIFNNMVQSAQSVKGAGGLLLPQEIATLWAADRIYQLARLYRESVEFTDALLKKDRPHG